MFRFTRFGVMAALATVLLGGAPALAHGPWRPHLRDPYHTAPPAHHRHFRPHASRLALTLGIFLPPVHGAFRIGPRAFAPGAYWRGYRRGYRHGYRHGVFDGCHGYVWFDP